MRIEQKIIRIAIEKRSIVMKGIALTGLGIGQTWGKHRAARKPRLGRKLGKLVPARIVLEFAKLRKRFLHCQQVAKRGRAQVPTGPRQDSGALKFNLKFDMPASRSWGNPRIADVRCVGEIATGECRWTTYFIFPNLISSNAHILKWTAP
jgi:hypothetical protein